MNLFDLLANFWRLDEQQNFSANETRLYFFLIHLANRSFWAEWIEFADKKMVTNANISLQVLKSTRERLKDAGLLDLVPGGGFRVKTKYRILAPNSALKLSHYNIKDIIPISVFVVQKIVFFKKNHIGIQENTTKRITVPQFDGIITD